MTPHTLTSRARRGLTLVELLLALAVTAIIGGAIAGMLAGAARGTQTSGERREAVVRQRIATARIAAAVRAARTVLVAENGLLVLWIDDTNGDALPSVAELRRIERTAGGDLVSYNAVFPDDWGQAAIDAVNASHALAADFDDVTADLIGELYFPGTTWAQDVSSMGVWLDHADPHQASIANVRVTVKLPGTHLTDTTVAAAALRNGDGP